MSRSNDGPPINPYVVLVLAILLPGAGHVAVRQPQRGLGFAFFAVLLALLSWYTTTPERSFIGRAAGGLFVWALSIPQANNHATIRNNPLMNRKRSKKL